MEDKEIRIPWGVKISELVDYGKPTFTSISKRKTFIEWKSAKILNGITADLSLMYLQPIFKSREPSLFFFIHASFDEKEFKTVRETLTSYSGRDSPANETKQRLYYKWVIDDCLVHLIKEDMVAI